MVILFIVTVGYNMIFINGSELDKEKSYINTNIEFTKTAYNINIDETNLEDAKTITKKETEKNKNVIDKYLKENTVEGYYTLNSIYLMLNKKGVSIPLITLIYNIVCEGMNPSMLASFLISKK